MRKRAYVGLTPTLGREVFMSDTEPTQASHGDKYLACTGPYYTKADAVYYVANHLYGSPIPIFPRKVNKMRRAGVYNA